jgi:ADP-heptose:LPS heptosyltransferase
VEQSARLGLLNFCTGYSFKALFKTGQPVYEAYGLASHALCEKKRNILIFPDARLKKREIPSSVLVQIPGRVVRFGIDYTNFEELIELIQLADYVYAADSLPLHLAYLCSKPHYILYPEGGKLDFFTPDALASGSYSTFNQFIYV